MNPISTNLHDYLPEALSDVGELQTAIPNPKIAKAPVLMREIENAVSRVPTNHTIVRGDARRPGSIEKESVHLVVTSPPYWTLKEYRRHEGQLGFVQDYEEFLAELDRVWEACFEMLVPGGRLVCVVGDVCLSRRKNKGEHAVIPLHSSIQERCRQIGFTNLAPIIWHKIANASFEVENGSSFLGKPYEPNAVIKNDIEYILMERKRGGYRTPSPAARVLSVISEDNHRKWFQQIWSGLTGASTRIHPAPFPLELASRLIRMFSFVGDTVFDPFMGTGTTNLAAAKYGRNSIGIEIDPHYYNIAVRRLHTETASLFTHTSISELELEGANGEHRAEAIAGD